MAVAECLEENPGENEYCECTVSDENCEQLEILHESFVNNTKANCVYEQLDFVCGNLFNETIGQFQEDKDLHLEWKIEHTCNDPNAAACTTSLDETTNTITIKLRPSFVEGTSHLRLAKTILHEAIHANIEAFLADKHDLANENLENTARLLQLYKYYKQQLDPYFASQYSEHTFMAEYYVNEIANALWELNGYQGQKENYLYFAWDGITTWVDDTYITDQQFENYRLLSLDISEILEECE